MQRAQRIDRIARAAARHLQRVQPCPRGIRQQQAHHFTAVGHGRGVLRQRFVRRDIGRDEQHLIQPQRFPGKARGVQMPQVRRVERPAEYARSHLTNTIFRLSLSRAWR